MHRKVLRALFISVLSLVVLSCANSGLFIANTLARFGDYHLHSDIPYSALEGNRLDIYLPDSRSTLQNTPLTTVIYFYGGCWGACSNFEKEDYRFVAQALTANNMIAVLVDYRKFPNVLFADIMVDTKTAVEWVNDNIEIYGGNQSQLFLMGHSAGAHIASMLNFNEAYLDPKTYENINGFIGLAGPYDFLPFTEPYQPALFGPPPNYPQSQTINFVDGSEPPALLLYGNNDSRVKKRNITSLAKTITSKNGQVETHFYDNMDHTEILAALSIPLRSSQKLMQHITRFILKANKSQNVL